MELTWDLNLANYQYISNLLIQNKLYPIKLIVKIILRKLYKNSFVLGYNVSLKDMLSMTRASIEIAKKAGNKILFI